MHTISNDILTISVKEHGAELASIKRGSREYLWQADPAFWARHSPVLFPIVGSIWNGEMRVGDRTYRMGQHGLARDLDFTLDRASADEVWYALTSTEATLERYPYPFVLKIGYKLIGQRVRVMWHVENPGAETMHFQIGAHPAFYWPMLTDREIAAGVDAMRPVLEATDRRGYFLLHARSTTLTRSVITEGGCVGAQSTVTIADDGMMPLTVETFAHDALVFEDSQIDSVTICDDDRHPYLTLEFTSPLVGLWSPPGKRAPFVCIEPWYGRCDPAGYTGPFADKPWMQHLSPAASFDASYDIVIH